MIFLLFPLFPLLAQTVYGDTELPPGAFLWLATDAATEALGGSGTGANSRTSAGWANPAALFNEGNLTVGATYSYLREATNHSNIFANYRVKNWSGAARLFLINTGDIEARTGPTSEPDYTFTGHQLYTQLSLARKFSDMISVGASAKWIHERLDNEDRSGWVFDFGGLAEYKFASAGISVLNWGNEVYFKKYREYYPITYRIGGSAKVLDYGAVNFDWIKPDKMSGWAAIGIEGNLADFAVGRFGYTPFHDTRNISAGFGVSFRSFKLDYALANYSEGLGMSHQVTLSYAPKAE